MSDFDRRHFLMKLGNASTTAAAYALMASLGYGDGIEPVRPGNAATSIPDRGQTVLILGAGIAGLTAAYELQKAGFKCIVLEAYRKAGGRNVTLRNGDSIYQTGLEEQKCGFDQGLYFNAGPGRIPHHHRALLKYCRAFGITLEVFSMESRATCYQKESAFFGRPVKNRQIVNDTRGWLSALLYKAIAKGALDDDLSLLDKDHLKSLLITFGDLSPNEGSFVYKGSSRSGYSILPSVESPGTTVKPLEKSELFQSEFWKDWVYSSEEYDWQATLFQPVGGMDRIVDAFTGNIERIGVRIICNAVVTQIEVSPDKVSVSFELSGRGVQTITGDYCICTIAAPILHSRIRKKGLSKQFQDAIGIVAFEAAAKVGWQAANRFWEKDSIHGGISWTNHIIEQMWYPSSGALQEKGILTGAYIFDPAATEFGNLNINERLAVARAGAEKLHPGCGALLQHGLSIAWQHAPHHAGGWAHWDPTQVAPYNRLLRPDGHFFVCGDQVSYLPGWQEGAILSAHHVVKMITDNQYADSTHRLVVVEAPNSRKSTRGR